MWLRLAATFAGQGSNSQLKLGHWELFAQAHAQMTFEYLQGQRLYNFPGQPVAVLGYPHSEKVFSDYHMDPPEIQAVPIASA